jgi:hypothetical protein
LAKPLTSDEGCRPATSIGGTRLPECSPGSGWEEQGSQEGYVDHAEDRRGRTDRQCQRQDRDGSEARCPLERSERVSNIRSRIFQPSERAHVSMRLSSLRDAAEAAKRRTSGFLVRQTLLQVLVGGLLQVRVDLFFQVPIKALPSKQAP